MMMPVLVAVLVICVFLTIYPYIIYPMILRRLPKTPLAAPTAEGATRFALLFCAHNEARALPHTIANLRRIKAAWPELAILAYSDNSDDRTFALLSEARDILTAVEGTRRAGKAAGMARLVAMSDADVLVFMDANVLIDPATVGNLRAHFARPDVGTVAGMLRYVDLGESACAKVGGLYWSLEERIKRLESETGSTMGADGSLFAIRREFYPAVAPDLQDDFLASMQPIFRGRRCISAHDVIAYERAAVRSADEFRRKRRIACGAYATHRAMAANLAALSPLDRFKYLSHKVVRWYGAFFIAAGLAAAVLLAAELGMLAPFLALAGGAAGLALLLARLDIGPARAGVEILMALVATATGILEALFGAQYVSWTPVER